MNNLSFSESPFLEKFYQSYKKGILSHALLLIDPLNLYCESGLDLIFNTLLCTNPSAPCRTCHACTLFTLKGHPDYIEITADKEGAGIKIEQIRNLHDLIYKTPQTGLNKLIVIKSADKMNFSAENALLKTLEDPPKNTYFILIAKQISSIAPTILSRCQQWSIQSKTMEPTTYLKHHVLASEISKIEEQLYSFISQQESAQTIAQQWQVYPLEALVTLIYLLTTQMINSFFNKNAINSNMLKYAQSIGPIYLFFQLDRLNAIIKNLHHTIPMNHLMLLEGILIGFLKKVEG